jgi:hypothetical protein
MSIFISEEPFELEPIFFVPVTKNNVLVGVKIVSDDTHPDTKTLNCWATGRDFDNFSKILENSTIFNHINGESLIRRRVFYHSIITRFFKSWNIYDNQGNMVPIESHVLNKMHDSLIRELAKKWLNATSGK